MMSTRVEWKGDAATAEIRKRAWGAIRRATVFFFTAIQAALNKSNPRPHRTPSAPGEPPRKRTGFLAANVVSDFDEPKLTGRVGLLPNAIYGIYLELGTRRMLARPWFMATLNRVLPKIQAILSKAKAW